MGGYPGGGHIPRSRRVGEIMVLLILVVVLLHLGMAWVAPYVPLLIGLGLGYIAIKGFFAWWGR